MTDFARTLRDALRRREAPVTREELDRRLGQIQGGGGGSATWPVPGTPSLFPPSSHQHQISEVQGLVAALGGKQAAGSYAAAAHGHTIADVAGLQDALNAAGGGSDPWTIVRLTTTTTSNSTTAANVAGFAFTPLANRTYDIEGRLIVRSGATTNGPRPGWTWPTGLDHGVGSIFNPTSATASVQSWVDSVTGEAVSNSTGVAVANRSYLVQFQAVLITGASPSGAFQIRLRAEETATSVSLMAGSYFRYREIA